MADAKSNYLEAKVLDHVLGTASMTSPTNVYAALFTSNPAEDASGTEVAGGSYARQQCDFDAAATLAGVTTAVNTNDVTFAAMPTAVVTHIGIYDASSSGNLLYFGALASSKSVTAGESVVFLEGDIVIEEK